MRRVTASVDDELWTKIDQMAREQGRSVSSMVAALLALAVFPGGRIVPPVVDRRSARGTRKFRGERPVVVSTLDGGEVSCRVKGVDTGALTVGEHYDIAHGESLLVCRYDGGLRFTELLQKDPK